MLRPKLLTENLLKLANYIIDSCKSVKAWINVSNICFNFLSTFVGLDNGLFK